MKNLKHYYPYVLLISTFILITAFSMIFFSEGSRLFVESGENLNEGWTYLGEPIDAFPTRVDVEKNDIYTVSITLDESFALERYILLRSSLSNISVTLDGILLYDMNFEALSTYASMWHVVRIPESSDGLILEISYQSPYSAMSGVLNEVHVGTDSNLVKLIVSEFGFRLFTGIFTLVIGLLLMSSTLIIYRNQNKGYSTIGLFSIFFGIWLISESRMLQFFTGNVFILGSISYFMVALFPIPINRFIMQHVIKHYVLPYKILHGLFHINLIVITLLYLFNILDFFQSAVITLTLLAIAIIVNIVFLVLEKLNHSSKNIDEAIKVFSLVSFFVVLELIVFAFGLFDLTSLFAVIGVIIIMSYIVYNYIRYIIERFKISYEKEFFENLAYYDPLTGAKNRLAFEQDFEALFANETLKNALRLTYCDVDNLKAINDTFGHIEGDIAIKKAYALLTEIFGEVGECYRLGGDEFACLSTSMDDDLFNLKFNQFVAFTDAYDEETEFVFNLSIGTALYNDTTDLKPSDMLKRADDAMYINKQSKKK
jgi:diguanylate cyclase (GGDEF)-like protein